MVSQLSETHFLLLPTTSIMITTKSIHHPIILSYDGTTQLDKGARIPHSHQDILIRNLSDAS